MRTLIWLFAALGLASPALAEGNAMASPDHVLFFAGCWSVSFTGPVFREQIVKKSAADRLESPSASSLAEARRPVIDVAAFPDSEFKCGNGPKPERLVVEAGGKRTPIPLVVTTEVKQNAFGARMTFATGATRLAKGTVSQVFAADSKLYLIFDQGPFEQWDAPARAMSNLWMTADALAARAAAEKVAATQEREAEERAYAEKQRARAAATAQQARTAATTTAEKAAEGIERACAPAASYDDRYRNLAEIRAEKLQAGGEQAYAIVRTAVATYRDCLTRMLAGKEMLPATEAAKLLALVGDLESLPALITACNRQKTNAAICAAAADLRDKTHK
jgi:hypothetical protein